VPLAHSFGERYDLPIPLALFVIGGALVVVLSFLLVLRRDAAPGPATPAPDEPARGPTNRVLGWLSVLGTAALVWEGFRGSQDISTNPLPTVFWLIVWIAVPLTCGLIGDWTRPVNPFGVLATWADSPRARRLLLARTEPLRWPDGAGWWPATVLFFGLACAELIFNVNATMPRVIATGLLVYAAVSLTAGLVFGRGWLAHGEVFGVLFATWGRLGWYRFGAAGDRGFVGGLRAVPFAQTASRISFVLLLLIAVNFDGLLATPRWARFEREQVATNDSLDDFRLRSFLVLTVLLWVVFAAFAYASARVGRHRGGVSVALAGLLPSMVPIAFAYLLAHNLQYLIVNSQTLFADTPRTDLLPSAVYWYVGVAAIVAAHVLAVILAHLHLRRQGADERSARRSEYPWLVAMVGYTMLSLVLIAQPLVMESSSTPGASDRPRPHDTGAVALSWPRTTTLA
jgi:hypothetical protein